MAFDATYPSELDPAVPTGSEDPQNGNDYIKQLNTVVNTTFAEHGPYFSPTGNSFWVDETVEAFSLRLRRGATTLGDLAAQEDMESEEGSRLMADLLRPPARVELHLAPESAPVVRALRPVPALDEADGRLKLTTRERALLRPEPRRR